MEGGPVCQNLKISLSLESRIIETTMTDDDFIFSLYLIYVTQLFVIKGSLGQGVITP